MSIPPFAAIITAAGASTRFSADEDIHVKKEYLSIDGHTVLSRAARPFFGVPGLSAMIVTCPEGSEDETVVALEDLSDIASIPFLIVPGGMTRKESVKAALEELRKLSVPFEYIAIHDGARPYIDEGLIIRTLAAATVSGGAVPALRVTDAVKKLGRDGLIAENVDRSPLITVQTPQIFRREELFDAYDRFPGLEADDDAAVFISAGYACTVSRGSLENRKITYFSDIPDAKRQAEEYAKAREEGRRSAAASRRMRELLRERDR